MIPKESYENNVALIKREERNLKSRYHISARDPLKEGAGEAVHELY